MKREVWRYGVQCYGVKNRCRKTEFHSANKGELGSPSTENGLPNSQEAIERATAWLNKNMKSHTRAVATATLWIIERDCETWQMFTAEHNLKFPLTYAPKHGVFALDSTSQIIG